jgi:hypothetical protein
MDGPAFFLDDLSQPHEHGSRQLVHYCTSALLHFQCAVKHSHKYEPELRVFFYIERSILVHNIHLLLEIQRINAQGR